MRQGQNDCVWGLDWPHVNLTTRRSDYELIALLEEAAPEEQTQREIMVENPARLYGFPLSSLDTDTVKPNPQVSAASG